MVAARALALALALAACRGPDAAHGDETTTTDDSTTGTTTDAPTDATFDPGPPVFPRLTRAQYFNSTRDLLGPDLPTPPLEPDQDPHLFFAIGAATSTLSERGAQQYEESANLLAHHIFNNPSRRLDVVGCTPTDVDDPCIDDFIENFGRRAYRRPLTADEQSLWRTLAAELALGDPWRGLRFVVAGMLQSPHFLYRVELGEPDPQDPTRRRYTGFEMAARLSFLLWNTGPDEALLTAAEHGELRTAASVDHHARRLLADPRARDGLHAFFGQYLGLRSLEDDTIRDPALYPQYTPSLPAAMRHEVELLLEDLIVRRDTDIRTLLNTRTSFHNRELAALYGTHPGGADDITYIPVPLPDTRAGLLSLAAFLTLTSHPGETSPTRRGKYLRERILCQTIPPPPPGVDASLDPDADGSPATVRERLEAHRRDPACAGCHNLLDPPGVLFEHFDPIGQYRDEDHGLPIDAAGDLDGVPLRGALDLAAVLAEHDLVGPCIVTQLHRHATGRLAAPAEQPALDALADQFAGSGHRFQSLLLALVVSDTFRILSNLESAP